MKKRVLICGVGGQYVGYLAHLLLSKGYEVFDTLRDIQIGRFSNFEALGIRSQVDLYSIAVNDF